MRRKIPAGEFGSWTDAAPPVSSEPRVELHHDKILHKRTDARVALESPPQTDYGVACSHQIVDDLRSASVRYLGYENAEPTVFSFDAERLHLRGSLTVGKIDDGVEGWGELDARVSRHDSNLFLVYSNFGDSLGHLRVLRDTGAEIRDIAPELRDSVESYLDAGIWTAELLSDTRVLVIDDIGIVSLFSLPDAARLTSFSVLESLRTPAEDFEIWAGSTEEDIVVGESISLLPKTVLLNLCRNSPSFTQIAMLALDAETLEPKGLVRPPRASLSELRHLGDGLFCGFDGASERFWNLTIP